jgi:hypothetical protein
MPGSSAFVSAPDRALWKCEAALNQQALVGAETERLKFAFMGAADF